MLIAIVRYGIHREVQLSFMFQKKKMFTPKNDVNVGECNDSRKKKNRKNIFMNDMTPRRLFAERVCNAPKKNNRYITNGRELTPRTLFVERKCPDAPVKKVYRPYVYFVTPRRLFV